MPRSITTNPTTRYRTFHPYLFTNTGCYLCKGQTIELAYAATYPLNTRDVLVEILIFYATFACGSIANETTNGSQAAFANGEGYNRANDNTTDTAQGDTFEEHAIAKKCHRRHLFCKFDCFIAGRPLSLLHSRGVPGDSIPVLLPRRCVR